DKRQMRSARITRAGLDGVARRTQILKQLDVMRTARQTQHRRLDPRARQADDLVEIVLPNFAHEQQLEPEGVAEERDGSIQIVDGEARVMDGHNAAHAGAPRNEMKVRLIVADALRKSSR